MIRISNHGSGTAGIDGTPSEAKEVGRGGTIQLLGVPNFDPYPYEQGSKDAMKGFNYDPPSLLKICDLLCVAIGGLM